MLFVPGGKTLLQGRTYAQVYDNFKWKLPSRYNIGVDVCDQWAVGRPRPALIHIGRDDKECRYTFHDFKGWSNRLANTLRANGINKGDRVGILLPQCPETLIAHISIYKLGAVALPLLPLFGPMALEYRLRDSEAVCVITDRAGLPKVLDLKDGLPHLKLVLAVDAVPREGLLNFWESLNRGHDLFEAYKAAPNDPALIIYTSGTTGQPKGTLHGHRILLAMLPGFEFLHNFFPQKGDLLYTPLDWAYIGGSYDALFPALHHGVPVLAYRPRKFDPEKALYMMKRFGVRNFMAVPTVLRMMMHAGANRHRTTLRSLTAGGEILGEALHDWCRTQFDTALNEQYGQTECDLVVGCSCKVMPVVKGCIGRAVPGHTVEIIDEDGRPVAEGGAGEIAVKTPDPAMFLGYWNNPQATADKYIGDWLRTGDLGRMDGEGNFYFLGRADDLIESGGYRIGPGEVENCLMSHAAVKHVCVLGVPDAVRGEIVKAFIVLKEDVKAGDAVEASIREHVKQHLEKHAYPRQIEFLKSMPMTKTGKIRKEKLRQGRAVK